MSRPLQPDDPRHGTPDQPQTAVVSGCPCDTCELRRAYNRNRVKRRVVYGHRAMADHKTTGRALNTLRALLDDGFRLVDLSRATGLAEGTLCDLLTGRTKRMSTKTAITIGRLSPDTIPRDRLSPIGTLRRIQALAAIGWPMRETCERAGLSWKFASDLAVDIRKEGRRSTISAEAASAVAAVFDELAMTPAPVNKWTQAARTRARRSGWAAPLAWDDIDDPNERPKVGTDPRWRAKTDLDHARVERSINGERLHLTRAERVEVVRRLRDIRGWSEERIEAHTGITQACNRTRYPRPDEEDAA